ncbi:MAG: hypothetical protein HC846_13035 [Blastocatellia bacterium]|nr:hypothetical protein [Blastocatellia bacterium]
MKIVVFLSVLLVLGNLTNTFAQGIETANSAYFKLKERTVKSLKENTFLEFQGVGVEPKKLVLQA